MNAKDKSLYHLYCNVNFTSCNHKLREPFCFAVTANDRCFRTLKPIVRQCLAYFFVLAGIYPKTKIGELPSTIFVNLTKLKDIHTLLISN